MLSYLRMRKKEIIIIATLTTATCAIIMFFAFYLFLYGKILPNTYVQNVNVGGLTKQQALEKLSKSLVLPDTITISIANEPSSSFTIPLASIGAYADYNSTINTAYSASRTGSKRRDVNYFFTHLFSSTRLELDVDYNDDLLDEQIAIISSQVPQEPQEPGVELINGRISYFPGVKGYTADTAELKRLILTSIKNSDDKLRIELVEIDPTLPEIEADAFLEKAASLVGKNLTLSAESQQFNYNDEAIIAALHPRHTINTEKLSPSLNEITNKVSRSPKNPVFRFENNKVQEFSPAQDGLEIDTNALREEIVKSISVLTQSHTHTLNIEIPLKRTAPDFATSDVNNLGIKELIGIGTSSFKGSIPSRVYNISHAASKLNGVLIKPGETFSFVNTLGDISALSGYKQAYIIQGNKTVLGDGGGVCQVSTTFFRASLNAGLPIIERHAHSYRVSYYEQGSDPGIDATIFHPTIDIKIKNDTPGHILIQTITDTKNMTLKFELYGTSDGRIATITKPAVSSVTPPPEDLYIDDPTLPAGEVKQIDYKAWGAKVNFKYSVERNGETIFSETFYSNYRPWQAKFLRGSGSAT